MTVKRRARPVAGTNRIDQINRKPEIQILFRSEPNLIQMSGRLFYKFLPPSVQREVILDLVLLLFVVLLCHFFLSELSSADQSYYSRLSAVLLSYDRRSSLIQLVKRKKIWTGSDSFIFFLRSLN